MKNRNQLLLLLLLIFLTAIWLISQWGEKQKDSTFATTFPRVPVHEVQTLKIYSAAEKGAEVILFKSGEEWRVLKGIKNAPVHEGRLDILLSELDNLKPTRLRGVSQEQWADLGMTDSASTRVIAESSDRVLIDFVIGSFQYYSSSGKGVGTQPTDKDTRGITYVRLTNSEEVYSADGFFGPNFNQRFETWRNQIIVQMDPNDLDSMTFTYPENSIFTITTDSNHWYYGDLKVKSESRDYYGSALIERKHTYFADGFVQEREPLFVVEYFMNDGSTIKLDAYEANSGQIIIHSSMNPESYFLDFDDLLLNEYFPPLGYFVDYEIPRID